jgi:hypothetical protein
MLPALKGAMIELKIVKKGQIGQLPLYAETKNWLCSENQRI